MKRWIKIHIVDPPLIYFRKLKAAFAHAAISGRRQLMTYGVTTGFN
jgi:hypothetical protein